MKKRRPAVVLLSLTLLAACKGGSAQPTEPIGDTAPAGPALATSTEIADIETKFCACMGDDACRASLVVEMAELVMTFRDALELEKSLEQCGHGPAIDELEELKTWACSCKDAACAAKVQERFGEFMDRHKSTKGSESQAARAGQLAEDMMECLLDAQQTP